MRVAVFGTNPESVHLRTYVTHLVAAGHEVTLVTDRPVDDVPVAVVDVARRDVPTRWPRGTRLVPRLRRLRRVLARGRFDVVSVQQLNPDGVWAALLAPRPCVPTCWGSDILQSASRPWWIRALLPLALRRATLVHAASGEIARVVESMGVPSDRIEAFNYGIDLGAFPLRDSAPEPGLVCWTRGLRPFYRAETLIAAWPTVVAAHPGARLVLAGAGDADEVARLTALAQGAGVGAEVSLPGTLDADGVAALLRRASVWVSVPPSDAVAISLQEAMASGPLPVVTDLPSMREGVGDGVARFVRDVVPEALAAEVVAALDEAASRSHEALNRRVVERIGDRRTNLARWEGMLARAASEHRGD